MDMISVLLTLRLAGEASPGPAPFWWGHAAQNLFLSAVAAVDPGLAERLHDEQTPHPYTVSTLMGHFPNSCLDPKGSYTLRLSATDAGLAALLEGFTQPGGRMGPGAQVELDRRPFMVEAVTSRSADHPWAGQADFTALAAGALARAEPPPRRITYQWTSPTAFRSGGCDVPLPIPELVFGGLLERWNAGSPAAFPPEARRYAAECLGVTRYDLQTRLIQIKPGAPRVGAVGQVTFTSLNFDRYWMGVMHALAAFSLYAGVGAGVSQGMGQSRVVDE